MTESACPSGRVDREAALRLLGGIPLGEVMAAAHAVRMQRHPHGYVTFVCDTNPNTTNVCVTGCRFCAFHRSPGSVDGYTLTPGEAAERVRRAEALGATTVLIQGGHNPEVTLADWRAYIRAIRDACPGIHIHPFDPAEVVHMAGREDVSTRSVLATLRDEGITTLPGGGAEVLSERVRQRISPNKCSAAEWLRVMEEAHELGFRTTATMMYGHVEDDEDLVQHLFSLRDLQDRTGGFTSFVPWSFKPGGSALGRDVPHPAHPGRYVRIIAVARLVLDNFDHVQSSWFSESPGAGQLGLLAGADDFGGVLIEENVLRQAGHRPRMTVTTIKQLIRQTGFVPAQRDSHYRIRERFSA